MGSSTLNCLLFKPNYVTLRWRRFEPNKTERNYACIVWSLGFSLWLNNLDCILNNCCCWFECIYRFKSVSISCENVFLISFPFGKLKRFTSKCLTNNNKNRAMNYIVYLFVVEIHGDCRSVAIQVDFHNEVMCEKVFVLELWDAIALFFSLPLFNIIIYD